jgi:hypothetical protein
MQWYGYIEAIDYSFSFGTVGLGETKNLPEETVSVQIVSNGGHKLEDRADETWTGINTGDEATLLGTGAALSYGEISLQADKNTNPVDTVETSYGYITNYNTETRSLSENGDEKPIYLAITTASSGLLPDTYGAHYYVEIAND